MICLFIYLASHYHGAEFFTGLPWSVELIVLLRLPYAVYQTFYVSFAGLNVVVKKENVSARIYTKFWNDNEMSFPRFFLESSKYTYSVLR